MKRFGRSVLWGYAGWIVVGLAVLLSPGCETLSNEGAKKGGVIGAVTGAAAGGIIGHQSGHGWEGALIGAAAGGLGGAVIGGEIEKRQQAENPQYVSILKIIEMSKSGVPDDVIIDEIRQSGSYYQLNAETITYLKDNQVSNQVIDFMLTRRGS